MQQLEDAVAKSIDVDSVNPGDVRVVTSGPWQALSNEAGKVKGTKVIFEVSIPNAEYIANQGSSNKRCDAMLDTTSGIATKVNDGIQNPEFTADLLSAMKMHTADMDFASVQAINVIESWTQQVAYCASGGADFQGGGVAPGSDNEPSGTASAVILSFFFIAVVIGLVTYLQKRRKEARLGRYQGLRGSEGETGEELEMTIGTQKQAAVV